LLALLGDFKMAWIVLSSRADLWEAMKELVIG